MTLQERLGYGADGRVVIVSCRGLGSCHASNVGTYDALRAGVATTASLMVPCPWARDALARYRGEDVGVELTLTAEYDLYRWGPITHAPSLVDGNGGFPSSAPDLWEHADIDESRRELRAQLERAIVWGFDVSHLSSHGIAMEFRPELFDVALELAVDFELPFCLPARDQEHNAGFPFRRLAEEEGVLGPDRVIEVPGGGASLERAIFDLEPGLTELRLSPAADTPELRALTPEWATHVEHLDCLTSIPSLNGLLSRAGVVRIGYRALRSLQRKP